MKDIAGKRFNKFTAIEFSGKRGSHSLWRCICDCGSERIIQEWNLITGNSRSCGCLDREEKFKKSLNFTRHPIYRTWTSMRQRCSDPKSDRFRFYGARGIRVCEEWQSFEVFRKDMEGSWRRGLTLDRIDNNGNYCKENCRWATKSEQSRNTRQNKWIEHDGKRMTISEWSRHTGIDAGIICRRINHMGWTPDQAVSFPIKVKNNESRIT